MGKVIQMNFFRSSDTSPAALRQQRWSTRLYLAFLLSCIAILLFYTNIEVHTRTITYVKPSVSDFERLLLQNPDNIQCPCSQKSIYYDIFLVQQYVEHYHPVCASVFISDTWISYLDSDTPVQFGVPGIDFRRWGAHFFGVLKDFCYIAKQNVESSVSELRSRRFIIDQMISREEFVKEINSIIKHFYSSISAVFRRNLEIFLLIAHSDAFFSRLDLNWRLFMSEIYNPNATFYSTPVHLHNSNTHTNCSCATSRLCFTEVDLFDYDNWALVSYHTIPGLYRGCSLIETVLQSSLGCFYSSECINSLIYAISNHSYISTMYWPMLLEKIEPLNDSLSRFFKNDSLSTVINAMFIESWMSNISYENFFSACAINECTFSYYYHFDFMYIVRTFLSVYSGLILFLQYISPLTVLLFNNVYHRLPISTRRVSTLTMNSGQIIHHDVVPRRA